MTSAPSIGFEYRPSRWPSRLLVLIGALALLSIWISGVPRLAAVGLSLLVMAVVAGYIRQQGRSPVRLVTWRSDGGWQLQLPDDSEVEAQLLDARHRGALIMLRLRWATRGRATLLLFPDNLDADTRRRLRMRLSASADSA